MGMFQPSGVPWRRVVLALAPWLLASACVALTIDGVAFRHPSGNDGDPMFGPGGPVPVEHAPAPKSQERTIDPSERIPV
ncbi:hypothetical protein [Pendulispora albinea]|uniref:Lipoprotein n=1 Tax=Pendulispora albinea TaxID=2741071 RepID=A0ABZ2M9L8_9BACT